MPLKELILVLLLIIHALALIYMVRIMSNVRRSWLYGALIGLLSHVTIWVWAYLAFPERPAPKWVIASGGAAIFLYCLALTIGKNLRLHRPSHRK